MSKFFLIAVALFCWSCSPPPGATAAAAAGAGTSNAGPANSGPDTRLVGQWHRFKTNVLDAPGGASNVSDHNVDLTLNGDGSLYYHETGKGIASGSGQFMEYDINDEKRGTWTASNGQLQAKMTDGTQLVCTYEFNDQGVVFTVGNRSDFYQRQ